MRFSMSINTFQDAVVDSCDALMQEYDFAVCTAGDSHVSLASELVSIAFHYDRARAYELSIAISRKSFEVRGVIPFSLGEVLREFNVPKANSSSYIQSPSIDSIAQFIREVCELLMAFCAPVLKGEPRAFENLRARRAAESQHYTVSVRLAGIRKDVDEAWRAQDYTKYRNLLTGLESVLSEVEKKKLGFAQRRTRSTN
jgi:hypothetical protein